MVVAVTVSVSVGGRRTAGWRWRGLPGVVEGLGGGWRQLFVEGGGPGIHKVPTFGSSPVPM